MKTIFMRIVDVLSAVLPFLKKKDVAQIREFSDMVSSQMEFLIDQLKKVLDDYFQLSDKMTEMHEEILSLRKQLEQAFGGRPLLPVLPL
jgi:cell shape-determining protein MreC